MIDRDDAFLAILELEDVLEALSKGKEWNAEVSEAIEKRVSSLRNYVNNSENKIVKAV